MSITEILKVVNSIKADIRAKMSGFDSDLLIKTDKIDGSIVTDYDLCISNLVKNKFKGSSLNFYSEEDQDKFSFPMVILDPIDGTKEFSKGIPECVLSFGIYYSNDISDNRNFSWIYNLFTEEEIFSFDKYNYHQVEDIALVSRSEFSKGLHKNNKLKYKETGSIAYKLMLLAKGKCRYVISHKPKNVWDIVAGSHILKKNGFVAFEREKIISKIENRKYLPSLIWCHHSDYTELISLLKN